MILDNWKTQDVSQFTLTSDSNPRSAGKYEVRQIKEEEHHNFSELCHSEAKNVSRTDAVLIRF